MFKKEITYHYEYVADKNFRDTFVGFTVSKVSVSDPDCFSKEFDRLFKEIHKLNHGNIPNEIIIKKLEMVSFQISFLGIRII